MGEYRCVNFYELCRLCTDSQGKKVHIFSEEGKQKQLQGKINKGLLINVDENDKLPKVLCVACVQQVEKIYDYKNSCVQAQNLLEGCFNNSKMRNGGQVYIKSGTQAGIAKVSEAPPLTPSFTITATPKMTTLPTQVTPTNVSSDFLSSIIQAVGIQANEEQHEPVVQQQQMPQYTLTIDGQTLKASPIQYKLTEATPTFNLQPSAGTSNESGDLSGTISVDEFLKLKSTPKPPQKKVQPISIDLGGMANAAKKAKIELDKKPKINFVLSTPTKQQQTIPMTIPGNTQTKTISLQQLLQGNVNKNQTVVPLMIKSDGTIEANNQILSQLIANTEMTPPKQPPPQPQYNPVQPPVAYVQLKIQQSPDGQPTVQLMPQQIPQTVQLSTPAFQNINIQQQIQQQIQAQLAAQAAAQQIQTQVQNQVQITPQQLQTAFNQAQQAQVQPTTISITPSQQAHIIPQQIQPQQQVSVESQVSQTDISIEEQNFQEVPTKPTPAPSKRQPVVKKIKQEPNQRSPVSAAAPKVQVVTQQQDTKPQESDDGPPTLDSIQAQQQMQLITSIKHEGNDPPVTLTTCDVCKKVFKRKEHLMQHLKSHVGLRPFKCEEPGCNKSFSRKEHLLRHIVSHTGKKMFSCDLCHKYFSRKDNLNKHRRTHPEVGGETVKVKKEKNTSSETDTSSLVTKIKARKQVKIKQEPQDNETPTLLPQPTYQPIKIQQTSEQMTNQPIQIQMSAAPSNTVQTIGTSQPQILQLPCIVSTSQQLPNSQAQQIAYTTNQTTTQATKTTYIKAVTSADGNTLYTIPVMQQSNFLTTNAQGELQFGGFKVENS